MAGVVLGRLPRADGAGGQWR